MDINTPSDLPGAKPAVNRVTDLLTQLRAAGSIEAEVVKLLQDNKLLLTSRLGQILTSNKLHYRPGDRVSLRLDDGGQQPVLKVSPPVTRPVSLDSRQHPELVRQLPPDRPLLARVVKIVAQRAEIQLADQLVKLPRQVVPVRNQLLSLQRNDAGQRIEITPLERKVIYKAILKQLVPRQADNAASSLVKLLNLVNPVALKPERKPGSPTQSVRSRQPVGSPPQAEGNKGARPRLDAAITNPVGKPLVDKPQPGQTTATGRTVETAPAARLLSSLVTRSAYFAPYPATPKANLTQARSSGVTPGNGHRTVAGVAIDNSARPSLMATSRPAAAVDPPSASRAQTGPGAGARSSQTAPAIPANGPNAVANATTTPARDAGVASPTTINTGQPAVATWSGQVTSQTTPAALQPLLQLLNRMSDIDGAQVKQWFELARLVKQSKSESASMPALDIFRILKQFAEREGLNRELSQVPQQNTKTRADADSAAARTPAQEAQLMQMREGIKLVEQSLSHNLLQRATLGLQQETQQAFSVSLALPFLDNQQVKPLYIDLAERNRAQSEEDKSWDIRLCFELAELGSISCHLVLEGLTIGASFYAEHAVTRERIEAELPQLRQQLSRAGFMPGEFHSFPGRPTPIRSTSPADFSESLVDIEV